MIEVKDLLLQTEDYYEVIDIFDTNRNGYLSVENIKELLNNFDYTNEKKRSLFLNSLFKDKKMIKISELL